MKTIKNVYDFSVRDKDENTVELKEYAGKVLLIVNTASKCGFTPQYEGLEELYKKYRDKGFEIIGFPCNQFGFQEPGDNETIQNFCKLNYGVSFPVMGKIKVNGRSADPLYRYLTGQLRSKLGKRISWNFTKFLIDKNGIPVKRFEPGETPEAFEHEITREVNKA